jgi:Patatin-like phospholipase
MPNTQSEFPLTLAEVLFEEIYGDPSSQEDGSPGWILNEKIKSERKKKQSHIALRDSWFDDAERKEWSERAKASDEIVPIIYQAIHDQANGVKDRVDADAPPNTGTGTDQVKADGEKSVKGLRSPRSALCLSGGGIRSATFNLGLLQGLARKGLLGRFDYLSTVSGGGFIGGWLTAWIHRDRLENVVDELGRDRPVNDNKEPTPLEPEPKPVYNLRIYANYLTPKTGLLSPDTWTLIAVYLRNLLLNWLVFLPAIMFLLMIPRIWAAFINWVASSRHPSIYLAIGLIGVVLGLIGLFGILRNLPSIGNRNWKVRPILIVVVLMLCLTAVFLCLYWLGIKQEPSLPQASGIWQPFYADISAVMQGKKPSWPSFVIVGALLPAGPLLVLSLLRGATRIVDVILSIGLVIAAGALTGLLTSVAVNAELLRRLADFLGVRYELLYASLAVPSILIVLMIGGTLIAGFSSRFSTAEDHEWWARCGAWTLLIALIWMVVTPLVMFGPLLVVDPRGLFSGNTFGTTKSVITTVVGIVSGALTLFGGSSSKTPAQGEEESNSLKSTVMGWTTSIAAAIFALFLIILLVWLTDWLLLGLTKVMTTAGYLNGLPYPGGKRLDSIRLLPVWMQLVATAVLFVFAAVAGYLINTNRFSLHYYWRNRIVRGYLGASNPDRDNQAIKARVANHFTGFAESDSIRMSEMSDPSPKKLFHVLNIALNLPGAEKLEWQDRKCESFTVSPLHCGSYWLGYRRSADYARGSQKVEAGKPSGISLGTAIAISGAAASPNMGYMMTSPVTRFLMTLFNVRLGFWLGNPGVAGGGDPTTFNQTTYDRDSPTQSVRPIFAEAMGMIDSESPYVYLSDGGHFENLGLYEMILRRCRFIVVSDASTDTSYGFDSLAMAIRQIRVDFGVPIDMEKMNFGNNPDSEHNYCAVGKIRYSCVDKVKKSDKNEDYDGVLIYIKPSLIDDEPRDILNYHFSNPTFPEESIVDQWFSESQFESYRALGNHMVEMICKQDLLPPGAEPLEHFEWQARAHVDRKPRT